MPAPIIVLVETQLGENIGMCARAMLNCGLENLRLVRPRDGWPSAAARATAADADLVIDKVQVFEHIDEAIADCQRVYAATARKRRLQIPRLELNDAILDLEKTTQNGNQSAVIFGPEASGLDNESISRADALIHFPTNPQFSSINLAQAVLLFAWQWWQPNSTIPQTKDKELTPPDSPIPLASRQETAAFLTRLEQNLDQKNFFPTEEQKPDTLRNLRSLFHRNQLSQDEVRLLQGVLTALTKPS